MASHGWVEPSVPARLHAYSGTIWLADYSWVDFNVLAESADGARALLVATYGEGHTISLVDDAAARRPR